jgi:putative Mg2+ transporter-C (MgtC) family protein
VHVEANVRRAANENRDIKLLCMASMSLLHRLEAKLPARSTLEVRVTFGGAAPPTFDDLAARAEARATGYRVPGTGQ